MPIPFHEFATYYTPLLEGIHDPGILKCVFTAGGPGSGKSFVANHLFGVNEKARAGFSSYGLKLVNSDTAFEFMLKKHGINPKDLSDIAANDPALWDTVQKGPDSIRSKAKHITLAQRQHYMSGRLGMIIDTTGDSVENMFRKKREAELAGYDTYLVFVNTSLDVALARNRARPRSLPDELVTDIWTHVNDNKQAFQSMFGKNCIIVDNNVAGTPSIDIDKAVRSFLRQPIMNPIGREWIRVMSGGR